MSEIHLHTKIAHSFHFSLSRKGGFLGFKKIRRVFNFGIFFHISYKCLILDIHLNHITKSFLTDIHI